LILEPTAPLLAGIELIGQFGSSCRSRIFVIFQRFEVEDARLTKEGVTRTRRARFEEAEAEKRGKVDEVTEMMREVSD
jgi:hypothetical protein